MVYPKTKDTDRGYAWVIMVNSSIGAFITASLVYSTGVIHAAVLENIDPDHSRASWVGSTLLGAFTLSGPLVGVMVNKIGCKPTAVCGGTLILLGMTGASYATTVPTLILSYGLAAGLGIGLVYSPVVVISGHYFEKRRALACGITISGAGLGLFAGAPLASVLLETYGLSGTFLLLGALGAHTCIVGMLMRPSPVERRLMKNTKRNAVRKQFWSSTDGCDSESQKLNGSNGAENEKRTDNFVHMKKTRKRTVIISHIFETFEMLKNLRFVFYLISLFFWCFGESACFVFLPSYAVYKGTSKRNAANLFTAMGAGSLFSRLMSGCAGGDPSISLVMLHMGFLGIASILTMTFPLYSYSFKMQLFFSAGYGLYSGGPNSLMNPLTVELLGVTKLATGFGLENFAVGIAFFMGPPIAGGMLLLGSAMAAPIAMLEKKDLLNSGGVQCDRDITVDVSQEDSVKSETLCDPVMLSENTD